MTKLLMTRTLPETVMQAARERFDLEVRTETKPLSVSEARAALWIYDAIIPTLGDAFAAEAFAETPRTKILANFGVGYNHIDATAARAVGVEVTNTPGAVTDATADIAMMLILMTCRRAGEGERIVRAGKWHGWQPTEFLGMHVTGKTLGIIGMGRIGKAIARRAQGGFGMKVVFHNRSPVAEPGVEAVQLGSVAEVTGAADVVVLAVPGGAETKHLIGAEALAAMKPTGYLVNISRGDVVDEAALIRALEKRQIAGAGLDVYEFEPKVPEALRRLENAVLLPHIGTSALEVREAMGMMAVENVTAFFDGRPVPNPV
jgi:gluconate 2-dehydrogenase